MNCFMYPGQPFSRCHTPADDADWCRIAELVRQHGRLDLASFSWLGGPGTDQVGYQLLGVAQSLYQTRWLRCHGVLPGLLAQHSLGIYPALVACGSLSEAQAIELTWRVGCALSKMGRSRQWALGSVIGLACEALEYLAGNHGVYLANHNTSRHFLLSGGKAEMEGALAEALETGAFSVRCFDVDAPLHTPLIGEVEEELGQIFAGYRFAEPALPLMNHLNQTFLRAGELPRFLLRQLQLPVYWERTYRALRGAGVARFLEVGGGESLGKFNRWIDGGHA